MRETCRWLCSTVCMALLCCDATGASSPASSGDASAGDAARDGDGTTPAEEAGMAEGGRDYGDYPFPCLGLGEREPTGEATFEAIYLDIFCKVGCTDGYCHGPRGGWGGLTMTSIEGAHAALVDQPPGDLVPVDGRETCSGSSLLRVEPGAPERSLLYLKVTGETPCGVPMPPPDAGRMALSAEEREQVRRWIEAGAPLQAP